MPAINSVCSPISPADESDVLALNNRHAAELSWLEAEELSSLVRIAFHAAMGFREAGRAVILSGKTVRYLVRGGT